MSQWMESLRIHSWGMRMQNEAGVMYAAMKVVQCIFGSKDHEVGENMLSINNYISKIITTI